MLIPSCYLSILALYYPRHMVVSIKDFAFAISTPSLYMPWGPLLFSMITAEETKATPKDACGVKGYNETGTLDNKIISHFNLEKSLVPIIRLA